MGKAASRKRQLRAVRARTGPGVTSLAFNAEALAPPTPGDLASDLEAIATDRAAFAAAPGLLSYQREPIGAEFRYAVPPGHTLSAVDVVLVGRGLRIRRPIFRRLQPKEVN